ncbi:MAG: ribosome maturation factor RimM [Alphaproteobacteria bacterium]|nr:ribosome maturation factor RimM [Alphaproteobacteria bacterium]
MASPDDWVCLGVVGRPHGVKGLVRIRPFTEDPEAVAAYGPLTDRKTGRKFTVSVANVAKGTVIARIDGIEDRDGAEALKGTELWVNRAVLPEIEDEEAFYHHDMIGLEAVGTDGEAVGEVVGIENFGAGDLLELRTREGRLVLVPFTRALVPEVDIEGGRVVIEATAGLLDEDQPPLDAAGGENGEGEPER